MKLQEEALRKRKPRTPAQLESDSKTVRYELEMLLEIAEEYAKCRSSLSRVVNNVFVESFAVHCRALVHFLYGHLDRIEAGAEKETFTCSRDNDVLAYDFDSDWASQYWKPTGVLVESKRQADKHVAHITTNRREVNQPGSGTESIWKIGDAAEAIKAAFREFLKGAANLDPEARAIMNKLVNPQMTTTTPTTTPTAGPHPPTRAQGQSAPVLHSGRTAPSAVPPMAGFHPYGRTE